LKNRAGVGVVAHCEDSVVVDSAVEALDLCLMTWEERRNRSGRQTPF